MLYFFLYFLEIYFFFCFSFLMILLTYLKFFKKSLNLNTLMCNLFLFIFLLGFFLQNFFFFNFEFIHVYFFSSLNFFIKNFLLIFFCFFGIFSLNYFNFFREVYVLPDMYLLFLLLYITSGVLINTWNLVVLYILIEIQNLIFFVLAGLVRNRWFVIESTFRYFLVSGFATLLFLLSLSFFWILVGSFDLKLFFIFFENLETNSFFFFFFFISLLFFLFSFFIKLGMFPFHWWLVDVYEGIPLLIVFFFMVFPKILLFYILLKFYYIIFFNSIYNIMFIFFVVVLGSIFWSFLRAMVQFDLVRFLVYSSIFNMGFIFFGFFSNTLLGLVTSLMYLVIYIITNFLIFGIFLIIRQKLKKNKYIHIKTLFDLSYLFSTKKKANIFIAIILITAFFSLAGVPPFSGFVVKMLILWNFIYTFSFVFFFIFLFISVLASFYYLRFVRFFFFLKNTSVINLKIKFTFLQAYVINILFVLQLGFFFFFFDFFVYIYLLVI